MPNQPKDPKPTPGPWSVGDDLTTIGSNKAPMIRITFGKRGAGTVGFVMQNDLEAKANAALIAAASETATERDRLKGWSYHVEVQCVIRHPETGDWNCLFCKAQLDGEESSATIKHTPGCLITSRDNIAKTQEVQDVKD